MLSFKRGYSRRLTLEPLEDRWLLAAVTVSNNSDVVNGDTSNIANLIATPGGDGISLREAIRAANADAAADVITFNAALDGQTILLNLANVDPDGNADLDITQPLTIDADTGLNIGITINANDPSAAAGNGIRVFDIDDATGGQIAVILDD